ncbi:NACHT domain- and WD repeat-containing protein 1-like [Saccoglossus kowalevskii]|uniref:NACHT and WD repeat domain-containing protein 1-like n=1 Tax=Saccoglossus kowalevskii TaxID=10224 RepID=A0ABM0H125_SACKO|nr:PREDICTED: NACHT and WD repeat domain-containing protein 1-like [Saccoglossus kowalevskii]
MSEQTEQLLLGRLGKPLPAVRSRIVRIFTSSTFTDTSVERNALMQDVYPKLRDYCKSKYGLEFQVVDMRWGVRDEATDDHMTSQLCMNEIAACQRLSIGPNFVTFLCQKYGYRPFPPKIPDDEFKSFISILTEENQSVELLQEWFKKDENADPAIWILQPISSILKHYNDNEHEDEMAEDRQKWWNVLEHLQKQLRYVSDISQKNGMITEQQRAKYTISVTHDEVLHGILDYDTKRENHCLCFVRKFEDLPQRIEEKEAQNYIDINWENNTVDEAAQEILNDLRDTKVPGCLDKANIIVSNLNSWSAKGIDVDIPEHKQYLNQFLERFNDVIVELIDRAVEDDKNNLSNHPVYEEILQHLTFCDSKCQSFHGREDLLSCIKDYLGECVENSMKGFPLIVHGESGSGKTSVIAKAAYLAGSEWCVTNNTASIVRFLGTTPASTGIRQLLKSLCKHILCIYGDTTQEIPDGYFQLVQLFPKLLQYATQSKPLVIFLDSLDQLSSVEGAHRMAWLPRRLPAHVAMVVSTLPEEHSILKTLKTILPEETRYQEVNKLSIDDSTFIMQSWLKSINRVNTDGQQQIVSNAIQQCSLPLFLKLLFNQASSWQSYLSTDNINVQPSVKDMISIIFDRLEEYHGKVLVSHALSYMTISQNGIGEAELEDLLSLDDEVLQDVYAYWLPPTRRIPQLLWTRIRAEINDYLVERESEGSRVIYWYHRQFIEVAAERYLHDSEFVTQLHMLCAEYFIGKWSGGKKKTFEYTDEQMKKFNKTEKQDEADRMVSTQPLEFETGKFNIRKLEQLPYHLIHARNPDLLKEYTLCNFQFISAKLRGMSLGEVLQDFTMALAKYEDDDEIALTSDTLRLGASNIREHPDNLKVELIGRLKDSKETFLHQLVSDAEQAESVELPLIPYNQCYPPPGGPLRTQLLGHTDEVTSLAVTSDNMYIVSGSKDKTAIVWEIEGSSLLHRLEGHHESPIANVGIAPNNLMTVTYCYTSKKNSDTSDEINVWNIESGEHFLTLEGHTGNSKCDMTFTSDSKYAVSAMYTDQLDNNIQKSGHYFMVWSLEDGQKLYSRVEAHADYINDIAVGRSSEGCYLVVTCGDKQDPCIKIWDLLTGQSIHEIRDKVIPRHNPCKQLSTSKNGRYIAFHFDRPGILDVSNGEFTYLGKVEVDNAGIVKFLDNHKHVLFKNDGHVETAFVFNTDDNEIVRHVLFPGGHGGSIKQLYHTNGWETIITRHDKFEKGIVWKLDQSDNPLMCITCTPLGNLSHNNIVNTMVFVNDSPATFAITGSSDKSIKIWNIRSFAQTAKSIRNLKEDFNLEESETFAERKPHFRQIVNRVVSLDEEKRVAILDNHGCNISLYDVTEGQLISSRESVGHAKGIGIAATVNGNRLLSLGGHDLTEYNSETLEPLTDKSTQVDVPCNGLLISNNNSVGLLLAGSRQIDEIVLYNIDNGETLKKYKPHSGVGNIILLTDQRMLLLCNNHLTMVDLNTAEDIYNHNYNPNDANDFMICGAMTSDEKILVTGYGNGIIKMFEVQSGNNIRETKAHESQLRNGHEHEEKIFTDITMSFDDSFFVTASSDQTAKVWDVSSLEQIHVLKGHTNTVMNAKITGDDQFILTSSTEIFFKVWNAKSGEHLVNIMGYSLISTMFILPQTNRVVVTTADERVMFFKVQNIQSQCEQKEVEESKSEEIIQSNEMNDTEQRDVSTPTQQSPTPTVNDNVVLEEQSSETPTEDVDEESSEPSVSKTVEDENVVREQSPEPPKEDFAQESSPSPVTQNGVADQVPEDEVPSAPTTEQPQEPAKVESQVEQRQAKPSTPVPLQPESVKNTPPKHTDPAKHKIQQSYRPPVQPSPGRFMVVLTQLNVTLDCTLQSLRILGVDMATITVKTLMVVETPLNTVTRLPLCNSYKFDFQDYFKVEFLLFSRISTGSSLGVPHSSAAWAEPVEIRGTVVHVLAMWNVL